MNGSLPAVLAGRFGVDDAADGVAVFSVISDLPQDDQCVVKRLAATAGIHHEYVHVLGTNSHLHVGRDPAIGSGFCSLTDQGTHSLVEPIRFTTDTPTIIDEYTTWTDDMGPWGGEIASMTVSNPLCWRAPTIVTPVTFSSYAAVELPASDGVVVHTPNTSTWATWSYAILPHSTMTGPGLILIHWVRTLNVVPWVRTLNFGGQTIQRPDRPSRASGEERLQRTATVAVSAWHPSPGRGYAPPTDRQLGSQMNVTFAHLCDYGIVSLDGKLSALGIFRQINGQQLPLVHPQVLLAFELEFDYTEVGREFTVDVQIVDEDGNAICWGENGRDAPNVGQAEAGRRAGYRPDLRATGPEVR